jgi:hypothetical protein
MTIWPTRPLTADQATQVTRISLSRLRTIWILPLPPKSLPRPLKGLRAMRLGWRRLTLRWSPTWVTLTAMAISMAPTKRGRREAPTWTTDLRAPCIVPGMLRSATDRASSVLPITARRALTTPPP